MGKETMWKLDILKKKMRDKDIAKGMLYECQSLCADITAYLFGEKQRKALITEISYVLVYALLFASDEEILGISDYAEEILDIMLEVEDEE